MLTHPLLEQLQKMRLTGMHKALQEQMQMDECQSMTFEERLGLMLDRETTERENRRLQTLLRKATLHQQAAIEDLDHHTPRSLDRQLMTRLRSMQWVRERLNLLITGPTGIGLGSRSKLIAYMDRVRQRPAVLAALEAEGLLQPAA